MTRTIDLHIPLELGYEKIATAAVATIIRRLSFQGATVEEIKFTLREFFIHYLETVDRETESELVITFIVNDQLLDIRLGSPDSEKSQRLIWTGGQMFRLPVTSPLLEFMRDEDARLYLATSKLVSKLGEEAARSRLLETTLQVLYQIDAQTMAHLVSRVCKRNLPRGMGLHFNNELLDQSPIPGLLDWLQLNKMEQFRLLEAALKALRENGHWTVSLLLDLLANGDDPDPTAVGVPLI